MRFVLSLLLGLGLVVPALAQEPPAEDSEPLAAAGRLRLTLEHGDHTGHINTVLFTPDGEQLITAGVDHTIRVWDRRTGDLLRVLRPPGLPAGLYPALSPDGKLLAVNAYHVGEDKTVKIVIYLMALVDGRIKRVLEGHAPVGRGIRALAFSTDGKRLASGAIDKTIRIWNLTGNEPARVIQTTSPVMALAFSPDGTRLVEAQGNHTVAIRDLANGKAVNLGRLYPPLSGNALAWSPDGKTIATASSRGVWLWEPNGKLRHHLLETLPSLAVAFNKDSRRVLVVIHPHLVPEPGPHTAWIFNVKNGKKVLKFAPKGFHPPPRAILGILSPDGSRAVTVGSSAIGNELFVWKTTNGAVVRQTASPSWLAGPTLQAGWSADGKSVSWRKLQKGETWNGIPATFDLGEMQVGTSPLAAPLVREAVLKEGPFELKVFKNKGPQVLKDGKPFAMELHRKTGPNPGFAHTLVGKDQVAIACVRQIYLMDLNSRVLVRKVLLRGYVRSLAPSPDGRYLLALADDQILRILSPARDNELLSLYVSGQDWIAWTPQGYYAATPGGERLMGWTVDNGVGKETSYFPAERFRKVLYRPDVIKLVLEKGSVEAALKSADATRGKKTDKVEVEQLLPPRCTLEVVEQSKGKVKVRIQAEARVKSQPLLGLRLFVDGRPYVPGGQRGLKRVDTSQTSAEFAEGKDQVDLTWTFTLPGEKAAGAYQLTVLATSRDAAAPSNAVGVSFVNPAKVPNLYVLTAGINQYDDASLTLNFAVKDATELAAAFAAQARKGLFAEVHTEVLADKEARRQALLDHILEVRKKVKANDLFVVYFAGHGVKEKEEFYLLPVEAKVSALATSALSGTDLRQALGEFPCQVLLMLDACHSAGFGAKGKLRGKGLAPATDDATRALRQDEVGVAVMCAAMGRETALEKDGNGLFTRAVLSALRRAEGVPFNRVNSLLYIHHLQAFVFDEVSAQSGERQHPFLSLPWVVQSFPVAKCAAK
jgi:WD40 repeat protein